MSINAQIQNVNLRRVRRLVSDVRHSAVPLTRAEVADAFEAVLDLIAPFSAPRPDDADALLAGMQHDPNASANLAIAAAAWSEVE